MTTLTLLPAAGGSDDPSPDADADADVLIGPPKTHGIYVPTRRFLDARAHVRATAIRMRLSEHEVWGIAMKTILDSRATFDQHLGIYLIALENHNKKNGAV